MVFKYAVTKRIDNYNVICHKYFDQVQYNVPTAYWYPTQVIEQLHIKIRC